VFQSPLGAPKKISNQIIARVEELTLAHRRMSCGTISNIIAEEFYPISVGSVSKIRRNLGFEFLFPMRTFFLTDIQKANRLQWCLKERDLTRRRDWNKVIFTDESYFWLGEDNRRLWRRPGEKWQDVRIATKKFGQKVMVFGGFCATWQTALIAMEHGTVDSEVYIEELIDQSGLIAGMNEQFGIQQWTLMQDGATAHRSMETMEYLRTYCDVLEDWPSGSPDLNPIENLWAIMKCRVTEAGAEDIKTMTEIVFNVWESLPTKERENLSASMIARIKAVIDAGGGQTDY
jgi:hypothetical protein